MTRIFAITNQKGGVGKTTTSINLAASLAATRRRVLLVDMDPQGNATMGSGLDKYELDVSSCEVLLGDKTAAEAIQQLEHTGYDILPANSELTVAEVELMNMFGREFKLKKALETVSDHYDYILIDCPPSLNLLTVNAMVAAHSVLVPLQAEFFALEGLSQLMLSVREVRQTANANLRIEGIVLTMYDRRNNLSQQVEQDARDNLGDLVRVMLVQASEQGKDGLCNKRVGSRKREFFILI